MVSEAVQGLIGSVVMLTVPAYLVLQAWAALKLTGGWRVGALAPLLLAIPAIMWSLLCSERRFQSVANCVHSLCPVRHNLFDHRLVVGPTTLTPVLETSTTCGASPLTKAST
jgi:hypothetical protein